MAARKTVVHIVGARPNFIKMAAVFRACAQEPLFAQTIVHTGQHFDRQLSAVFFEQLGLPAPDFNLEVGGRSPVQQVAAVLAALDAQFGLTRPDGVFVYGDVTSTLAGGLYAAHLHLPLWHVEAGLRSFDRSMPEEVNRIVVDQLADLLFTHSPEAAVNLTREGVAENKIHFVGNCMIDTLLSLGPHVRKPPLAEGLARYVLVTLHRPANVDSPAQLDRIMAVIEEVARQIPVVFPVHPRTRRNLPDRFGGCAGLCLCAPQGYLEFLWLQKNAVAVITDSGGIQEETTFWGIPCLTLRDSSERPITITSGTNTLIGTNPRLLIDAVSEILKGKKKTGSIPRYWDGKAGDRIAAIIKAALLENARS